MRQPRLIICTSPQPSPKEREEEMIFRLFYFQNYGLSEFNYIVYVGAELALPKKQNNYAFFNMNFSLDAQRL